MNRLIESIRSLFNKKGQAPEDVERLRVEFRQRYHSFKLLLGANSKALVIMADIEQALAGPGVYSERLSFDPGVHRYPSMSSV